MANTFKIIQCVTFLMMYVITTTNSGIISAPKFKPDEDGTELVLVHALCRHGIRTTYSFYPNDPHKNNTFYPVGPGGMLNQGKLSGFKLGETLRKEYGHFLGDLYSDELIKAMSTDTSRTRMTAQVILAGLFPPNEQQRWHPELNWMPIPVYSKESKDEDTINANCPYREQLLEDLPNQPEVFEKFLKPHQDLMDYISRHSGMKVKSITDIIEFYFIVNTEDDMGLKLPEWVKKIYPDAIYMAASENYAYQNHNLEVKRIQMGYFLKQILSEISKKASGELKPEKRKMFLVGGHETTLGWMMEHFKVIRSTIPPYSSSFVFETRRNKDNKYFVKLRYLGKFDGDFVDLKLPNCPTLCPLEDFMQWNEDFLPKVTYQEACHKMSLSKNGEAHYSKGK